GPRKVVYDNGEGRLSIVAARGGDGKPLANRAPKRFNFASQPVWDPEGKKIVYRTGKDDEGQAGIWVMDLSKGKPTAQALTNPGFDADTDDRRPAISPDGKVVAFVRGEKKRSDHDLCFVAIAGSAPPSCIPEPDQEVTRPTWAPDGKAILVVASDTEDKQYELLRYTSEQPGSPDASDWQDTGFETDELHSPEEGRHVVAVAWSPARDRRRVAFAADWTSPGDYGLFIGNASEDGKLEAEPKRRGEVSIACELSWSSNGKELAVVSKAGCGSEGSATISLFAVDDPRPSLEPLAEGRNPSLQPDKPAP
ncbi:MAG: LpqB family beta-propeller domain-containing protein, partial [Actinomycetota bacterium]|nr:LpqB family beta-propeller domain-containing protein [Actinomycetota bacterium]